MTFTVAARDFASLPPARRGFGRLGAWAAALAAAAGLVVYLDRALPMSMDEALAYRPIACLHYPGSQDAPFAPRCSDLDLAVLPGRYWPLRAFEHEGSVLSVLYYPLFRLAPSPWSARLLGVLLIAGQAVLLAPMTGLPAAILLLALLAAFPYSFIQATYGMAAFHALLVCAAVAVLESRWERRPAASGAVLGLMLFAGFWARPTFVCAMPALALWTARRRRELLSQGRWSAASGARFLAGLAALGGAPTALLLFARDRAGEPYHASLLKLSERAAFYGQAMAQATGEPSGPWSRARVMSGYLLNPLQASADFFFPAVLREPGPWGAVGIGALLLWAALVWRASAADLRRDGVRGLWGLAPFSCAMFALTFATAAAAGSMMRHVSIAFPFLALSMAAAAGKLLREGGGRWALAAVAALGLYLPCWAAVGRLPPLVVNDPSRLAIHRALQDPGLAGRYAYVALDWGVYNIIALYGRRDQIVLQARGLSSPEDISTLKDWLGRRGRKALFIARFPVSAADVPRLQREFSLERLPVVPREAPWQALRER